MNFNRWRSLYELGCWEIHRAKSLEVLCDSTHWLTPAACWASSEVCLTEMLTKAANIIKHHHRIVDAVRGYPPILFSTLDTVLYTHKRCPHVARIMSGAHQSGSQSRGFKLKLSAVWTAHQTASNKVANCNFKLLTCNEFHRMESFSLLYLTCVKLEISRFGIRSSNLMLA